MLSPRDPPSASIEGNLCLPLLLNSPVSLASQSAQRNLEHRFPVGEGRALGKGRVCSSPSLGRCVCDPPCVKQCGGPAGMPGPSLGKSAPAPPGQGDPRLYATCVCSVESEVCFPI